MVTAKGRPSASGTNLWSALSGPGVRLSILELESTCGAKCKAIISELKAIQKQNPDLVILKDTEQGLSINFKGPDMEVELMLMWGPSGDENAETLESKLQFITKKVYLDNGERNRVSFLLQSPADQAERSRGRDGKDHQGGKESQLEVAFRHPSPSGSRARPR
jgi:hypothetical protein